MIGCVAWAVESAEYGSLCLECLGIGNGVLASAGIMLVDFCFGAEK